MWKTCNNNSQLFCAEEYNNITNMEPPSVALLCCGNYAVDVNLFTYVFNWY